MINSTSRAASTAEIQERLDEEAAHAQWRAHQADQRIGHGEGDREDRPGQPLGIALVRDAGTREASSGKVTRHAKLHRGHFAFMRAYVQGLDVKAMWTRYLAIHGDVTDLRSVRRGLRALRGDLAAAAQRAARPYMERVMRDIHVDIKTLCSLRPARLPTLDEFAFEQGLDDERETDQLLAYHEAYGKPTQQEARRVRLLKHQLAALRWLEVLAAETPTADDAIAAWLREEIAAPLASAGVITLRQLVERINGLGRGWSTGLRGIGAAKAARVVAWMRDPKNDIGVQVGEHAGMSRRTISHAMLQQVVAPATGIVPFEKFIVPAALNGAAGVFRGPQPCMLTADTDVDAMLAYIRSKPGLAADQVMATKRKTGLDDRDSMGAAPLGWLGALSKTQADYLSEIYRFMLWSILECGKATSSINMEDAAVYRDFLANPQPAARWCSSARGREKYGPAWRPFAGPLSAAAANKSLTILSGWYNFLHRSGYQTANPFAGLKAAHALVPVLAAQRGFTPSQWAYLDDQLAALPATSAHRRLCFGMRVMYATGMRRAEAVGAKIGHLRWVSYPPTKDDPELVEGWELSIVGKGNKRRVVPVPDILMADLLDYLASRGLARDLGAPSNQCAYLLGQAVDVAKRAPWSPSARSPADPLAGIGAQTWHDQIKAFFQHCASQLKEQDPAAAAQLERASAHWLRHTKISHSLAAGTSQEVERELAGHQSLATTSRYTHTSAKQRMRGSAEFFDVQWGQR